MTRIAIVCGGGIVSGKEIMVLQLATGLRDNGFVVEVVNSHWSDGNFAARLEENGIPIHPVWFGFISATLTPKSIYMTAAQILRWPQLLAGYRRFLRAFAPDRVIHTNWHSLLMIYPFLKNERNLFWVHEVMPNKSQYRRVFWLLEPHLRSFVCVSNASAESLRKLGVSDAKVSVIYNGLKVPENAFSHNAHSGLRIGIVGQIGAWKGHTDLIEAFGLLKPRFPNAELHIFGDGSVEYIKALKGRARELAIEDAVRWRGFVKDPNEIYGDIDLLAVPSRSADPLPTSAIEAALFGLPVVATRNGGLPEIVKDGITGSLVEAAHPEELASRLGNYLADEKLRRETGGRARIRAEEKFSSTEFVKSFTKVLD